MLRCAVVALLCADVATRQAYADVHVATSRCVVRVWCMLLSRRWLRCLQVAERGTTLAPPLWNPNLSGSSPLLDSFTLVAHS